MEIEYVYTKKRSEFGRQCLFTETPPRLLENILPNKELTSEYILENPVDRGMNLAKVYAEHEVGTALVNSHGAAIL